MDMEGQDETLTEEQKAAAAAEEQSKKQPELTDEQLEIILQKKFGAGSKDLIKKTEQVHVLTEAEKAEAEEKKQSEALKWGLENGRATKKKYDEYLQATKADKIDVVRKKFIADHPEFGDNAERIFNKTFRIDEDDELENEDEEMVPNEYKKAARLLAEKIADEQIAANYSDIKDLPKKYDEHLAVLEVKRANEQTIIKAIADIPRQTTMNIDGFEYQIAFDEKDFAAAEEMVRKDALEKKDLTADDVKANVALFLKTTNIERILQEVRTKTISDTEDRVKRGQHGLIPDRKDKPEVADEKMKFLKAHNMTV